MILRTIKDSGITRLTLTLMVVILIIEGALITYGAFNWDQDDILVFAEPEQNDTLHVRGAVMAHSDAGNTCVSQLSLTVSLADGAEPVNFTMTPDSDTDGDLADEPNAIHTVVLSYLDAYQQIDDITWRIDEYGIGDGDMLLEEGETFRITIGADSERCTGLLKSVLDTDLIAGTPFAIQVRTPDGETLAIERTIPDTLSPVMNLY